jgi:hypothetical protein
MPYISQIIAVITLLKRGFAKNKEAPIWDSTVRIKNTI